MSLPNMMEWFADEFEGRHCLSTETIVTARRVSNGKPRDDLVEAIYRIEDDLRELEVHGAVKSRKHAEIIIRAFVQPETLEVKE